jgi:hypothetical protein
MYSLALCIDKIKNQSIRRQRLDLSGCFETVQHRHRDVQNHQIWFQLPRLLDSFLPIFRFSAHLAVISSGQE